MITAKGLKTITAKWLFESEADQHWRVVKAKERLVEISFRQCRGGNFFEPYTPTPVLPF